MADREKFTLNLSDGGSSVPTAGGEEFPLRPSIQPKITSEESAAERGAMASGQEGYAPKRMGEVEEPWRAVDSQLTVPEELEGDDPGYEEFKEKIKARYAANVQRLLGNNPNVVWVDFPDCCVRPPGVEFPKPRDRRPFGQEDAAKEVEEELSGAVVTPPVSA